MCQLQASPLWKNPIFRSIPEWNSLPAATAEADALLAFKSRLAPQLIDTLWPRGAYLHRENSFRSHSDPCMSPESLYFSYSPGGRPAKLYQAKMN